jgi:hypothetical protein
MNPGFRFAISEPIRSLFLPMTPEVDKSPQRDQTPFSGGRRGLRRKLLILAERDISSFFHRAKKLR